MTKRNLSPFEEALKDEIEPDVYGSSNTLVGLFGIVLFSGSVVLAIHTLHAGLILGNELELAKIGVGGIGTVLGYLVMTGKVSRKNSHH